MRPLRLLVLVLVLGSACTVRDATFLGTDGGGSGDDDDAHPGDPNCNRPIALGHVSASATSNGAHWLAAARTATGLVVAYVAPTGLVGTLVDLVGPQPVLGPEVMLGASLDIGNLQIIADSTHITASMSSTGGLVVIQTDLALANPTSRTIPELAIAAPDHSAVRSDGTLVVAGSTSSQEQLAILGPDPIAPVITARSGTIGGSLITLPSGFAAVWSSATLVCDLRIVDDTLATTNSAAITQCLTARIAASPDASRIATSFQRSNAITLVTYDAALAVASPPVTLAPEISSSRLAAGPDAFWMVVPALTTRLVAVATSFTGSMLATRELAPYLGSSNNAFTHDVVGAPDGAWAVWLDQYTNATLYVERLCR